MSLYSSTRDGFPFQCAVLAALFGVTVLPSFSQTPPVRLTIVSVSGDGAVGRVGQRAEQDIVIRVVDGSDAPVSGAAVVFTLPTDGATGVFSNGATMAAVVSDREGYARSAGLRFNGIPGKVPIHINASYKGLTARATVVQVSQAAAGYKAKSRGTGKLVAVLAILGAAGAAGAWYGLRDNGAAGTSTAVAPAATPIGITAGAALIAPPR